MNKNLEALNGKSYGRIENLLDELEAMGFIVPEISDDDVYVLYQDGGTDVVTVLHLVETARTITVDNVREV